MIVNHLLLKLKDRSPENLERIQTALLSMRGRIDVLLDAQAEINVRPSPSAYDLILITRFASLADMEEYLIHPAHQEVAGLIGTALETQASVCCEI
ncbi:stress protein [Paenibacillus sp. FSL R7-0273]|uniref:Dabb family protein n=1 Tax=Paenibacillus sp. FSL R7-0273 TaxID=1536772 RepID=UPI0004F8E5EB|nr:Dabb family protein [Paenibacillus sp. FSL R7-0273]AIQ47746.1 stress protein [Paenibacillus sp. FSL R7-0273]OMF94700.1 stress protein [Paenibacillus sp. FSL R7-0273]